ncbi:MAG TPA: hypothetical protein VMW23_02810 [Sedimentisphaerales bacterium]|nr:hypothetical protein [Sedimentisphaerales bacterium]
MQGQFNVFWSLVVPAVMAAGSIIITYALYRHFACRNKKDK